MLCFYLTFPNTVPPPGVISIRRTLDRESIPEYHLQVTASDGPGLSCLMDVYINLMDINDYVPTFPQSSYQVFILESAEVNTLLTRVSADDYDLGDYGIQLGVLTVKHILLYSMDAFVCVLMILYVVTSLYSLHSRSYTFSGINRKVRYAITDRDGMFSIDRVSGIITLRKLLDRERKDSHNITIHAQDQVAIKHCKLTNNISIFNIKL